jgi:chromosomal replication initiator protein
MSSFWSSCLSQFEQELPPQQFNTWIRPLRLEGEDDLTHGLRLLAPNGFILKWVKERYLARIEALGSEYFSVPVNITFDAGRTRAAPPNPRTCRWRREGAPRRRNGRLRRDG